MTNFDALKGGGAAAVEITSAEGSLGFNRCAVGPLVPGIEATPTSLVRLPNCTKRAIAIWYSHGPT